MGATAPRDRRYVMLDWDNTLHDSATTHFEALRMVLAEHGLTPTFEDYRRAYTVDWRRLYRALGLAEERIDEASTRWRALVAAAEPRLLPGAGEALSRLAGEDRVLGLVTSGPRALVEPQVERLGLGDRFAARSYGDGQPPRPDPRPLLELLARLAARHDEAVLCSDTTSDMEMARAAGVAAVGIASFAFDDQRLCLAGAEETAPSLADWVDGRAIRCPP